MRLGCDQGAIALRGPQLERPRTPDRCARELLIFSVGRAACQSGVARVVGENWVMRSEQPSFTDVEYANRRRVSRREEFLQMMDATIPWTRWVGLIEPHYYTGKKGRGNPLKS